MIIKLCKKKGIVTINTVTNAERKKEVEEAGGDNVINWEEDQAAFDLLESLSQKVKPTVYLECRGSGYAPNLDLFKSIQDKGTWLNYGSLNEGTIGINPEELILKGKTVRGFSAFEWFNEKSAEDKLKILEFIKQHFEDIFKTEINEKLPLVSTKEAFKHIEGGMPKGKILLVVA